MSQIQAAIEEIDKVELQRDDAVSVINEIIKIKLKKLPAFMTDLKVGEPLVRSRYLTEKEEFHHSIQDYSPSPQCLLNSLVCWQGTLR